MTDSDIVKGFECCNNGWCDNRCPYYGREDIADCREQNGADLLDFINRKQAEIERLTKQQKTYIVPARGCGKTEFLRQKIKSVEEAAINRFAERLVSKAKSAKERFLLESLVESVMKEIYG